MNDTTPDQQDTSLEDMQSILEAQKKAYLAEGEVSYATRYDRLERAINVVRKNEKRFVEAMTADFGHRNIGIGCRFTPASLFLRTAPANWIIRCPDCDQLYNPWPGRVVCSSQRYHGLNRRWILDGIWILMGHHPPRRNS